MLKGANQIQWRIRFLEMTEVSATDLHMSRKFPDFLKVDSQNRIKTTTRICRRFYVIGVRASLENEHSLTEKR